MVRPIAMLLMAAFLLVNAGCSKPTVDFREHNDTNVERVRNMYVMYMNGNTNVGPKSQEQLKEFITTNPRAQTLMSRIGLNPDEFDSYLIGSRDGKPLVVRWGLRGQVDHAIAFEKVGVDGMRYVALGDAREVGEEEYNKLLEGEIKPEIPTDAIADSEEENQ